ncbi:MAG: asparagine--tRNA ligase [Candidatus Bipolaricaulota bacterium]
MTARNGDGSAPVVYVEELFGYVGQRVTVQGWVAGSRSSGRIRFLIVRDGTGLVQGVVTPDADSKSFALAEDLPMEAAVKLEGTVRTDDRAPGGVELAVEQVLPVHVPEEEYPIAPKEHGVGFLMQRRHLWIRGLKQVPLLRVRDGALWAMRQFFKDRRFVATEAPILVSTSVEGTTTLFTVDYFGQPAYLSQSGQLYLEATCAALGKVYWIGPVFRAEKSKTRRHLTEFWMLEAEVAYLEHEANLQLQEDLVRHVVEYVAEEHQRELEALDRDPQVLVDEVREPFARLSYADAVELVRRAGVDMEHGQDLGTPAEDALSQHFGRPVFVERFPVEIKPFYMKRCADDPSVALCADLIAPEGYGEIIGGSQRVDSQEELERQLREAGLAEEPYQWYVDLRRWGAVPHSGFGLGVERTVAWLSGIHHLRETVPFPRMLDRLEP